MLACSLLFSDGLPLCGRFVSDLLAHITSTALPLTYLRPTHAPHFHHHLFVMGGLWGAKTHGLVDTRQAYQDMIDQTLGDKYNDDQICLNFF